MACRECHLAKVKCDKSTLPCVRCANLGLECVEHVSRQGQGRKKRRRGAQSNSKSDRVEEGVLRMMPRDQSWRNHYGIHFVIRHWVAIAFSRRSFSLLRMASTLANDTGITMGRYCGGRIDSEFCRNN